MDDLLNKPVPSAIMSKRIGLTLIELLVAIAIVAFINSKKVSSPEQDYAEKLAELKADHIDAATSGGEQQQTQGSNKRKSTRKSPKTRST